jgi:hypothetical protein
MSTKKTAQLFNFKPRLNYKFFIFFIINLSKIIYEHQNWIVVQKYLRYSVQFLKK